MHWHTLFTTDIATYRLRWHRGQLIKKSQRIWVLKIIFLLNCVRYQHMCLVTNAVCNLSMNDLNLLYRVHFMTGDQFQSHQSSKLWSLYHVLYISVFPYVLLLPSRALQISGEISKQKLEYFFFLHTWCSKGCSTNNIVSDHDFKNELQKEYCVKIKIIALAWRLVILVYGLQAFIC